MKTFTYEVAGFEFFDVKAFGEAWKAAKAKATELNAAIYRTVEEDEEKAVREVYCNAGFFDNVKYATENDVKIWGL